MKPKKIHDLVWLIGSGTDESVLTDPHDCHTYLVWDGTHGFLIDCGTGLGFERWSNALQQICESAALAGCLVTHYHADHAGGAAQVSQFGIPVFGSEITANALQRGDEQSTQLSVARTAGIYPSGYALRPASLTTITGGQVLRSGGIAIEIVDAPGHCDGHLVFIVQVSGSRLLFSGDCLFAGGRVSIQAIPDCRLVAYGETVADLAEREIDVMLPGHGELVLSGAGEQIHQAASSFARLIPPQNFLTS